MLTQFSVKNYKCLADVSLPLTPIHVIIGENDTGKTSLFEAIRIGTALCQRYGRSKNGPFMDQGPLDVLKSVVLGGWKRTELVWRSAEYVEFMLTATIPDNSNVNESVFRMSLPMLKRENSTSIHDVSRIEPHHVQSDALRFNPKMMARPSVLYSIPRHNLFSDGFGLPTLLAEIADYDVELFREIQTKFASYFKQFTRIRLENTTGWERVTEESVEIDRPTTHVGKQVCLVTKDGEVRLQQASDGAVLLLGFLAVMHSPKPPAILLIEEPENGIHPKRLQEVARLLRQFTQQEKNAPQIIMTTHSPWLLSEFQPEEVTLMRRQPDGSAKAFPLRDAKHIRERMGSEFDLGELWYNLTEEDLLK